MFFDSSDDQICANSLALVNLQQGMTMQVVCGPSRLLDLGGFEDIPSPVSGDVVNYSVDKGAYLRRNEQSQPAKGSHEESFQVSASSISFPRRILLFQRSSLENHDIKTIFHSSNASKTSGRPLTIPTIYVVTAHQLSDSKGTLRMRPEEGDFSSLPGSCLALLQVIWRPHSILTYQRTTSSYASISKMACAPSCSQAEALLKRSSANVIKLDQALCKRVRMKLPISTKADNGVRLSEKTVGLFVMPTPSSSLNTTLLHRLIENQTDILEWPQAANFLRMYELLQSHKSQKKWLLPSGVWRLLVKILF
ncbi:unnamed protein product [Protopolystoma xenopodis]|uniref:Uncharacterized protein n=1 Tax=Protopolystoma xenopodis TaxID=117903 RepID=A0A448XDF1_9PLAT|nr:unnamed protein product [Protopolystoma xenopodis]